MLTTSGRLFLKEWASDGKSASGKFETVAEPCDMPVIIWITTEDKN
jgi:hypothetical protein